MKRTNLISLMLALVLGFSACKKDDTLDLSDEKSILSFHFNELSPAVAATIDQNTRQITALLPPGTLLGSLSPTILVAEGATVSPASGVAQNFVNPVVYTVTAENKTTIQYSVIVSEDATATETLSGLLSSNRTLINRNNHIDYIIDGEFAVEGNALLTVAPGVKIVFTGIYSGIVVRENAGLKLQGTPSDPIILTGPVNNNNKGAWAGIRYTSNRADNIIEHAQIINAGTWISEAAVYVEAGGSVSIKNTLISGSAEYGILQWGGRISEFSNNTVADCNKAPIYVNHVELVANLNNTNSFTNNGNQHVLIQVSYSPESDFTLKQIAVPYYFSDGLSIDKTFNIEAGTHLLMGANAEINVYEGGRLNANGNTQNPVQIKGALDEAGYWRGIILSSNRDNTFNYCMIRNAGSDSWWITAAIHMYAGTRLSIHNSAISKSRTYGVLFDHDCIINHSNVAFSDCAMGNVYDAPNERVMSALP